MSLPRSLSRSPLLLLCNSIKSALSFYGKKPRGETLSLQTAAVARVFRVPRLYRVVLNEIYYDIWRVLKGFNKRCECVFELVLGSKIGEILELQHVVCGART